LRDCIEFFGDDYGTPDGTCVRDYIHVSDLAEAHVHAVRHLRYGGESLVLNCGYGRGYSVKDVLSTLQAVTGEPLDIRRAPRRAGDSACLIADATKISTRFGWKPRYDDLDLIIRSALRWEKKLVAMSGQDP
jgi:UDP-glucose 4-epimerase